MVELSIGLEVSLHVALRSGYFAALEGRPHLGKVFRRGIGGRAGDRYGLQRLSHEIGLDQLVSV